MVLQLIAQDILPVNSTQTICCYNKTTHIILVYNYHSNYYKETKLNVFLLFFNGRGYKYNWSLCIHSCIIIDTRDMILIFVIIYNKKDIIHWILIVQRKSLPMIHHNCFSVMMMVMIQRIDRINPISPWSYSILSKEFSMGLLSPSFC